MHTFMTIYLSIFYKKKQIPSERLCRAHLECVLGRVYIGIVNGLVTRTSNLQNSY